MGLGSVDRMEDIGRVIGNTKSEIKRRKGREGTESIRRLDSLLLGVTSDPKTFCGGSVFCSHSVALICLLFWFPIAASIVPLLGLRLRFLSALSFRRFCLCQFDLSADCSLFSSPHFPIFVIFLLNLCVNFFLPCDLESVRRLVNFHFFRHFNVLFGCSCRFLIFKKRQALEEKNQLELYASALDEDLERLSTDSEDEQETRKARPNIVSRRRSRSRSRGRSRSKSRERRRRSLSTDDRRGGRSAAKDTEREIEENNALRKKLGLAPLER